MDTPWETVLNVGGQWRDSLWHWLESALCRTCTMRPSGWCASRSACSRTGRHPSVVAVASVEADGGGGALSGLPRGLTRFPTSFSSPSGPQLPNITLFDTGPWVLASVRFLKSLPSLFFRWLISASLCPCSLSCHLRSAIKVIL